MEKMLEEYREAIGAKVESCTDASLLDLIYQILCKNEKGASKNG